MKDENETPNDGRVTEWLRPAGACGPTCYPNCRSNIQWCRAEVERLAGKGIRAKVVQNDDGQVAVFKD